MKDNELLVFSTGNEGLNLFLRVLKQQKKTDIWKRCYTKELKVIPLDNPIGLPILRSELDIPQDDDVLMQCMNRDAKPLLLQFPLEKMICVPLRDTAFSSLCGRGHISGTALQKMSGENFATIINICLAQWGDSCLVLYRDNKISAVHSGDANDYAVLIMYDLVKIVKKGIEKMCNREGASATYEFMGGFLNHSICTANFLLKDREIQDFYTPFLKKMGYDSKEFYPVVKFASSDVGVCGANLAPILWHGNTEIQIGQPMSLPHKNRASLEMFEESIDGIYALFQSTLKDFEKLEEIWIEYPDECFNNLCKKVQLGSKSEEAFIDFQNTRGNTVNALELYFAICEVITYAKNQGMDEAKIFKLQEQIARILTLNIKAYDTPRPIK